MRILHVTREAQADRRYGLGKSLQPIVEKLTTMGHITRYLTKDDLDPSQIKRFNFTVKLIDRSFLSQSIKGVLRALTERIQMGYFAMSIATKLGYSHVHAHDPWIGLGVRLGGWRYRAHGIRWGITQHGYGAYARATLEDGLTQGEVVHRALLRLERWVLSQADWVLFPTRLSAEALMRDLSMVEMPERWRVVPHAVPCNTSELANFDRALFGWKADDFVVLAVGRIVPLKRFELLIEVCASLSKTYPNIKLQILGEGNADGLIRVADRCEFTSRLSIASTDSIGDYYRSADIYVSSSRTESFGLANLEAICAGLPCVLSSVGGVPEVTGSGGWLIDGNYQSLSNAISALVSSHSLRTFWRKQAINRTASCPSLSEVVDEYVSIYS